MLNKLLIASRRACLLMGTMAVFAVPLLAQAGDVTGTLRTDLDGDGKLTPREAPIAGRLVFVQNVNGRFDRGGFTDASGRFSVPDLPPGRYRINPMINDHEVVTIPKQGQYIIDVTDSPTRTLSLATHHECIEVDQVRSMIQGTTKPGCYSWDLTLRNVSMMPMSELYFNPPAPGFVMDMDNPQFKNHVSLSSPLMPGQTHTFHLMMCGMTPSTTFSLPISIYTRDMMDCCMTVIPGVSIPAEECIGVLESFLKCRKIKGGYTWDFCFQNLTGKPVTSLHVGGLRNSAGAVVGGTTKSVVTFNPPLGVNATTCLQFVIPNAPDGSAVSVALSLYDQNNDCCGKTITLQLPNCIPTEVCEAHDYSLKPDFREVDDRFRIFSGRVAAITKAGYNDPSGTSWPPQDDPNDYVLQYLNISGYPFGGYQSHPIWHVNDPANLLAPVAYSYNGPPDFANLDSTGKPYDLWTEKNLGHIFGLTIDRRGHTYVTHFGMYAYNPPTGSNPIVPAGLKAGGRFGVVYKIDGSTGQISVIAQLPNDQMARPGLGNITYDGDHDRLYVTNFSNGMIYQIDPNTPTTYGYNWTGAKAWGPFTPKTITNDEVYSRRWDPKGKQPKWAPLGERVFGIQYHCGRLYFGRWSHNNNSDPFDPNVTYVGPLTDNDIWSVQLDASGDFLKKTLKKEPGKPGGPTNPVSDISFSYEGRMGTAEMTVIGDYSSTTRPIKYSHSSEATEYWLTAGSWVEHDNYVAGGFEHSGTTRGDCQGGLDYDVWGPAHEGWLWFTMANARPDLSVGTGPDHSAYGLVAFKQYALPPVAPADPYDLSLPLTNVSPIVIDYDLLLGYGPKRMFGDVEIPNTVRWSYP